MIAIHLLPLNIRAQRAPYLWVFHRALSRLGMDAAYVLSQAYIEDEDAVVRMIRSREPEATQQVVSEFLHEACAVIPDDDMGQFLAGYANYTLAWRDYLTREIPELVRLYESALERLLRKRQVRILVTWCNCPSLASVCKRYDIRLFHQELGSLRLPGYLPTVYLDGSGVNGNTEAEERYRRLAQAGGSSQTMSRHELLELFSLEPSLHSAEYEGGIALQVEDDSNVIAFSGGFDNAALLGHVLQEHPVDSVLVRDHPAAYFSYIRQASVRAVADDSASSAQFLGRIKRLYTINSSVGVEALLRGIPVACMGDAPYKFVAAEDMDSAEFTRRLDFYCLNYLVPEPCLFDLEYLQWRAADPSEEEIRARHLQAFRMMRTEIGRNVPVTSSAARRSSSLGEELARANERSAALEERIGRELAEKDVQWREYTNSIIADYRKELEKKDVDWRGHVDSIVASYQNELQKKDMEWRRYVDSIVASRQNELQKKDVEWRRYVDSIEYNHRSEIVGYDKALSRMRDALPLVSLVVVNYNGLRFLPGLLKSLYELDYPNYEVVLVDNASSDASLEFVERHYPQVRVVRSGDNLGFAGGNNLGMRHSCGELIGLVNNDAEVERPWLSELVVELMRDQAVWVVGSKIVFFRKYVEVRIRSRVFCPARLGISNDSRDLGLLLDERSAFADCDYRKPVFAAGFYGAERYGDRTVRWTNGDARLFLPVMPSREEHELVLYVAGTANGAGGEFEVEIAGNKVASGYLADGFDEVRVPVVKALIEAHSFQLINNAGTWLDEHGNAGDRGIYEPDTGQYDQVQDMPALCGASMLFKRSALEKVGLFDSNFFMYYEDTDLCWRIGKMGGVLRYVPASVIRHIHTGSSVEWSPHFLFHVARNHVLIRFKHAPLKTAIRGYLVEVYRCLRSGWIWLRHDYGRNDGPGWREFRLRLKIQRSLLTLLPVVLLKRWGYRGSELDILQ